MSARVLLVEDEPALAGLLARFLERAGFSATICTSGSDALAAWDHSFALAVVDLGLPDMAGEFLVHQLLERLPDLPLVVSSGTPIELMAFGLDEEKAARVHILQKPYLPGHLLALIARIGVRGESSH